jgi:hypothetical protein
MVSLTSISFRGDYDYRNRDMRSRIMGQSDDVIFHAPNRPVTVRVEVRHRASVRVRLGPRTLDP